jgi:subtilisin-like proprotein convertase family protein
LKGTRIVVSRIVSLVIAAGLLAGIASGVLATAQSPPPDNRRHLLLVPSDAEGTAALARTDARVIAKYEAFSLVEAQGGDDERLRRAGADRRDDMRTVETAAGEIDPLDDRRSLAGKEAPERDETLALVQFIGPPKEAWVERLRETGARIVTYQAENAYVVHASGAAVDRLAALQGGYPAVRAVSVLTAADKLEERSSVTGVFAVTTVTGGPGEEARDEAAAMAGAAAAPPVNVGALRTDYRALTSAEVAELARDPGVVAVEADADPELFDERAAQIVAGNLNGIFEPTAPTYLDWLRARIPDDTFDFAIDVADGGLDNGSKSPAHTDFGELGTSGERVSYNTDFTSPPSSGQDLDQDPRDCSGHGTNVASIAVGYNAGTSSSVQDSVGFNHGLGVAPFARLGASKIFRSCGNGGFAMNETIPILTEKAWAAGARISNNSWGTGNFDNWGEYSARARAYDQMVRDAHPDLGNQGMVEVFAAGNDGDGNSGDEDEGYGTISAEGSAKNVITVGGSEGVRLSGIDGCGVTNNGADSARDLINFSSRGPTDDGRLKPDLVAPGSHITGAAPQHPQYTGNGTCNPFFGGSSYSLISGTSQAAPQVSGAAAVFRRWYELGGSPEPSPALTKAVLINTATDLAGGDNGKGAAVPPGPNADQGWGRVNLGEALGTTPRVFLDQRDGDVLEAGESRVHTFSVDDPDKPVKVTLVWTDVPGPPGGDPVVNNLDLLVHARGETFKGNVFAGAFSRTGGTHDQRNNVESVHLPPGEESGLFSVRVVGTNVPGDGVPGNGVPETQDYALVVSNAAEESAPVLVHEATTIDDSDAGDNDGVLESDEEVELTEVVRNGGDAAATGLLAELTSNGSGLTVTADTSAYPSIDDGDTGENLTSFAAELANSAPCGADVSATLQFTTGVPPGSDAIPVVLPTGEFGASRTDSAAGPQVPVGIPDDEAGGVSSSVVVTERGRIKDLNVTISSLQHGWVGDLVIDLIGPDGTRVRLVEHPGGPDNNGNDFVNTVFDDDEGPNIAIGSPPYTGSFGPQNDQLSRFDGKIRRGTWTLRVRDLFEGATGTLSAWGLTSRKALCDMDTDAPDTSIDSFPGSPENETSANFEFSSDDSGATFECKLDSQPYGPCEAFTTLSGLSEGSHTLFVRAIDGSDNEDPDPDSHTWVVDITPPDTTITSGPTGFTKATNASFGFSSEPMATFQCSFDGADFDDCSPLQSYSGLADGPHTFRVRARDLAENDDPTPAERTWTVDTQSPMPVVTTPAQAATTPDRTPVVRGIAGTAPGDAPSVEVRVYQGVGVGPAPIESHAITRDAAGSWSFTAGLGDSLEPGVYTVEVRQFDAAGNPPGISTSTFTVVDDFVAPNVSVSAPANGSTTQDTTPTVTGVAGTAEGDEGVVMVKLFSGTLAAGLPAQTLIVPRDEGSGAWSATPAPLAEGTWTVRAEQLDSANNLGSSNPSVFVVDLPDPPPPPAAPSFVLAPAEERIADALGGRLRAVAGCASACRIDARLTASPRAARNLGLGRRSTVLGKGSQRLPGEGTATATVRLTKRARAALRRKKTANVSLRLTLSEGGRTLALTRTISLRRSAGLASVVSRGLRFWAVCSERCPLSGKLTLSARDARRIALKPRGSARVQVAAGRMTAEARTPTRLTLRVSRAAKKALRKARRVRTLLEAVAGGASEPRRTVSRTLTLRR